MAPSGDVKNQGLVYKARETKQRELATGTNLVKMPLGREQGCDCDHMGAHKGLAQVGE
jgi:hypothetical protein